MSKITLRIKLPKKSTGFLFVIGLILFLLGVTFSFLKLNSYLIGVPLISGILILFYVNIAYPLKEVGKLIVTNESIEIYNNGETTSIDFDEIQFICLKINGYELELRKDWTILSRDFFPYEHGDNNNMELHTNENKIHTVQFFMSSKNTEKVLVNYIKSLADQYNFELKIS